VAQPACQDVEVALLEDRFDRRLEVVLRTVGVCGEIHILGVEQGCFPTRGGIRHQCYAGDGDDPAAVFALAAVNEDVCARAQRLYNQREGCLRPGLP
jgi:hypothetical protein